MSYLNSLAKAIEKFESQDLHIKIRQWGATLVGFGDVSVGLAKEFKHIPKAISLAIKHPAPQIIRGGNMVPVYNNQFPEIDERLKEIQKKIVTYLRLKGWKALAIPPDSDQSDFSFISRLFPLFQHKTAATCSGLGWIGKNGLLLTKRHGARVSWSTVLTDAPLEVCSKPYTKGKCGSCNKCVSACPAHAITDEEWVRSFSGQAKIDVEACSKQLAKNFEFIGKQICGLCILACPLGGKG